MSERTGGGRYHAGHASDTSHTGTIAGLMTAKVVADNPEDFKVIGGRVVAVIDESAINARLRKIHVRNNLNDVELGKRGPTKEEAELLEMRGRKASITQDVKAYAVAVASAQDKVKLIQQRIKDLHDLAKKEREHDNLRGANSYIYRANRCELELAEAQDALFVANREHQRATNALKHFDQKRLEKLQKAVEEAKPDEEAA